MENIFYSETTPLQRGQTSAGYQCLRLIIINKHVHQRTNYISKP